MPNNRIYLDYNATTPLHPEVKKVISKTMDMFGNPSSLHGFGREARQQIEKGRATIASFIGAGPDEIIFVGSGTEANNTVLSLLSCPGKQCLHNQSSNIEIITTKIEHPCIIETSKCLEGRGIKIIKLDVDKYGKINSDQLKSSLTSKTLLVSIMMANNEIGTIQDIKNIADIVHKHGALFHTDAVQAVGKIPVNVKDLNVDFLTLSAHKIYGPKGIGALYVKSGISFCPLIRGGHQEKGRRAGTENILGIIGFAKAVEMRSKEMNEEADRLGKLSNTLKEGLKNLIPNIQFNGHPVDTLYNTVNVSFNGAEGEAILLYLDLEGIAVSTGSACASGSLDPSHVLLATGLSAEQAHGSTRISLGRHTTAEDIKQVLNILPGIIKKIRNMSTAYSGEKK